MIFFYALLFGADAVANSVVPVRITGSRQANLTHKVNINNILVETMPGGALAVLGRDPLGPGLVRGLRLPIHVVFLTNPLPLRPDVALMP